MVGIPSVSDFIAELADVEVLCIGRVENEASLSQDEKLLIAEKLLQKMESSLLPVEARFFGSDTFEPHSIKDIFEDKIIRKYTINQNSGEEFGRSQKTPSETNHYENLDAFEWYAYDDNFGTSEEKLLVRTLKHLMNELEEKWTDIYLLRNEKGVRIYNFEDGQAFEPDFLLFANDKKSGNTSWQIFIEPKGSQFLDSTGGFDNGKEGWKQRFLNEITKRSEARTLVDDDRYIIVGLPFYNHEKTEKLVKQVIKNL